MEININIREFIELVLLEEKYASEKKYVDFYRLERKKSKKYRRYISLLYNQICWEEANTYLKLVNLLLQNELTIDDFQTQFYDLRESTDNNCNKLIKQLKHEVQSGKLTTTEIEINPQSKRFSRVIEDYLFNLLEVYNPKATLEDNLANPDLIYLENMSGPLLKSIIEERIKPKLENYCDGKRLK